MIDAALTKAVMGAVQSDRVESVAHSLSDVSVVEIPIEDNEQIFEGLQQRPACKAAIDNLLRAGEFVCQGQSALIATVKYEVKTKLGTDLADSSQPDTTLVKSAIEAETKTALALEGQKLRKGTGLFYGVKVNPVCITTPSATRSVHLPTNSLERFIVTIRRDFGVGEL